MSERGLAALRADRAEVLEVARSLSAEEWTQPSDCDGWRVQDVVNHMANVFRIFVDPGTLPPPVPGSTEATQDKAVDACREWPPERVLADYEEMSGKGVAVIAGMVAGPMAENIVPLDDLGNHPLHRLANALAFDHFCHLRNDILRPHGPINRPAPPSDALRVGATLEWLLGGLPQMSRALAQEVERPLELRLTGEGGGVWSIRRGEDGVIEVPEVPATDAGATITSPATEFVIWATHRRPWRDRDVEIEGDVGLAERVLDAIHVF